MSSSDTTSLLSARDPPPAYTVVTGTSTTKPPRQPVHPELQTRRPQGSPSFLLGVLVGVLAATLLIQIATRSPSMDPAELERLRREFAEDEQHRLARREEWAREDQVRLRKAQQWDVERRKHEADKQHWSEELSRTLGGLWDEPRGGDRCIAYGTREYTAHLDELSACKRAPMVVHGQTVTAQYCEVKHVGYHHSRYEIVGHFDVNFEEPACRPYWGSIYDKGCVSAGRDYGMHRVESRLWGIRGGDDWQLMCDSTPATINGIEFTTPTRCENRGFFWGMVGIFDYPDPGCGWNSLSGLEEETAPDSANQTLVSQQ